MTTHDSRTTPADRAIVEAVIAAWMQMRHGPKLRTDEPMARASLAAAQAAEAEALSVPPAPPEVPHAAR